jgi:uncharacterized repeat protein (TIGR03803 family)
MNARIFAVVSAFAVVSFSGCSGMPQSNLTPANGSLAPALMHKTGATESVLHSFAGSPTDGADPVSELTNVDGTFYGTTLYGGANDKGAVFTFDPSTGNETLLYSFKGGSDDGAHPHDLINVNGTLYGTTGHGGASDKGTVFKITTDGTETVLYSFAGTPDGEFPPAGLTYLNGILYGTTFKGGASDLGTVFKITTVGTETVLYNFAGGADGARPEAGLAAVGGTLYGTTQVGGGCSSVELGCGTVFRITPTGTYKQLHVFTGVPDGAIPVAGLTLGRGPGVHAGGTLYGTTSHGGHNKSCPAVGGETSCGTVFAITTSGKYNRVYDFGSYPGDGHFPYGNLIVRGNTLYGTTYNGGTGVNCGSSGCGTVFAATKAGAESVLYSFGGTPDGSYPVAGLTYLNGILYGTTRYDGANNKGTVFSISGF